MLTTCAVCGCDIFHGNLLGLLFAALHVVLFVVLYLATVLPRTMWVEFVYCARILFATLLALVCARNFLAGILLANLLGWILLDRDLLYAGMVLPYFLPGLCHAGLHAVLFVGLYLATLLHRTMRAEIVYYSICPLWFCATLHDEPLPICSICLLCNSNIVEVGIVFHHHC